MKNTILLSLLLACAFLVAFSESIPVEEKLKEGVVLKNIDFGKNLKQDSSFNGKMFEFSMTFDLEFCQLDSLVEGDCNSGFFYFTPKGNVIYNYLCLGTEDVFCMGKMKSTSKGMDLIFDMCYTFKFTEETDSPTWAEVNGGKLEKMDPFTIHLNKLNCHDAYAFIGGANTQDPEYYIVTESDSQEQNDFLLRDFKQIKILKQF